MNPKHRKILEAIRSVPTPKTMPFRDIEALLGGLGCTIKEGRGSRVKFTFKGESWLAHRPHPGNDALAYQIRGVKDFLDRTGAADA